MPIKSLFVPPQALQGEDVPAHILWDSLSVQSIKIHLPEQMSLKELYNVEKQMFDVSGRVITVKKVEVDGYLGMLLATEKLKECLSNAEIRFSVIDMQGNKILDDAKTICLFRPELEIVELPQVIEINPERSEVSKRIRVRKRGQGTLIINFNTPEESEVQKNVPDNIFEFLKNMKGDLETNLNEVRNLFPQYSGVIAKYMHYLVTGWANYSELEDLKKAMINLVRAMYDDDNFGNKFLEALVKSFIKNTKFFTLPESLLKYLDSIQSKRVWLIQPWQIIQVSKETKRLVLEILPTDVLLDDYKLIRLRPINIKAISEGNIEIAKLLEWK